MLNHRLEPPAVTVIATSVETLPAGTVAEAGTCTSGSLAEREIFVADADGWFNLISSVSEAARIGILRNPI